MIGQNTDRAATEQAKKTQDTFQRLGPITITVAKVGSVAMNFVSGIQRAARSIPREVGKANLHGP